MVQYIKLSCGTTHHANEVYDEKGNLDESLSHKESLLWYFNEVYLTRGKMNKFAVVCSMLDYIVTCMDWINQYPRVYNTLLEKLVEFRCEDFETSECHRLLDDYFGKICPEGNKIPEGETIKWFTITTDTEWSKLFLHIKKFFKRLPDDVFFADTLDLENTHSLVVVYKDGEIVAAVLFEHDLDVCHNTIYAAVDSQGIYDKQIFDLIRRKTVLPVHVEVGKEYAARYQKVGGKVFMRKRNFTVLTFSPIFA